MLIFSLLLGSARAQVTVQYSSGFAEALARGEATPPTAEEATDALNAALNGISADTTAANAANKAIADALRAGRQTILLLCRSEAENRPELEAAYQQSEPGMLGGGMATRGAFDGAGNPLPQGIAIVVVDCGSIAARGLVPTPEMGPSNLSLLGHELVHASGGRFVHGPDDPGETLYNPFGNRVAADFVTALDEARERRAREERRRRPKGPREHSGLFDPDASSGYAALNPGLLHVPCTGGDHPGFEWGAEGGALLPGPLGTTVGVGGRVEHAISNPGWNGPNVKVASHQIRIQAEGTAGVEVVPDLFVFGSVAAGVVLWPTRVRFDGSPAQSTTAKGVAVSTGAGARYALTEQLFAGGGMGFDIHQFFGSGSYSNWNFDVDATVGVVF
ncbi:MAG: hypothetical protein H6737_21260 [Alphaproteobacteria bacterium]|nr:hypothetical protein [Alphaproteobacteria bacterium]